MNGCKLVNVSPQSFHWQVTSASVAAEGLAPPPTVSSSSSPSSDAERARVGADGSGPVPSPSDAEVEMSDSVGDGARPTGTDVLLLLALCGDEGGCCDDDATAAVGDGDRTVPAATPGLEAIAVFDEDENLFRGIVWLVA